MHTCELGMGELRLCVWLVNMMEAVLEACTSGSTEKSSLSTPALSFKYKRSMCLAGTQQRGGSFVTTNTSQRVQDGNRTHKATPYEPVK